MMLLTHESSQLKQQQRKGTIFSHMSYSLIVKITLIMRTLHIRNQNGVEQSLP